MKRLQWIAAIALSSLGSLLPGMVATANPIVPQAGDPTQVQPTGNEFTITGGVSSADGQALFHAFEQLGLSQGQIATFLAQPEVRSILGGVIGGEASYIDGLVRVAGSSADLYLINPAGILFGPNAQLDLAGSFAATTASGVLFDDTIFNVLGNDDFSQLTGTPTGFVFALDEAGAIVNGADLTVAAGEAITLIGGQVISTGTLTAPGGEVTIAAIPEANLVRISHPGLVLNLEVATLPEELPAATESITPLSLPALLTGAPGTIATGLSVQPDGTVALTNSEATFAPVTGSAIATGTLNTSGPVGGDVAVVGDRVALLDATVNADGETGGGTVRLGGDYQGQPTLPGSALTYVDGDSNIQADADLAGDGGEVILWSDDTTAFYGNISANGGNSGGDGGFVEVSGAETLVYRGEVSAIAPNGQIGTLLLDPTDIIIRNGSADGDDSDISAFQLTEFTFAATDPIPTIIYESELENSPGNVDLGIRASNNITIEDLADNILTFQTDNVTPGSITFEAGNEFRMADTNDAIVAPRRSLTINAGTITIGHIDTTSPTSDRPGGTVTLNATGAIVTGDIVALGDSTGEGSGDIIVTGASLQSGQIRAGGGFANDSRVELTATSGDIIVESITAGGRGIEIDAARRFQARDTFNVGVRITLDSTDDAALIDFLMRGDPQPLIDADLVDNAANQVFITFPASVVANPGGGEPGNITIRHGGSAANNFSDGNITIEGSGAFPDLQFVSGPNDDHTISINSGVPTANFTGFTPLFSAGTFPDEASGTTGAILRGQGDSTLVTSFQNQPFVPTTDGSTNGGGTTGDATTGSGSGTRSARSSGGATPAIAPDLTFETATFENLSPDDTDADVEDLEAEEATVSPPDDQTEDCEAAIASRSGNTVEITSTCESPRSSESPAPLE